MEETALEMIEAKETDGSEQTEVKMIRTEMETLQHQLLDLQQRQADYDGLQKRLADFEANKKEVSQVESMVGTQDKINSKYAKSAGDNFHQ